MAASPGVVGCTTQRTTHSDCRMSAPPPASPSHLPGPRLSRRVLLAAAAISAGWPDCWPAPHRRSRWGRGRRIRPTSAAPDRVRARRRPSRAASSTSATLDLWVWEKGSSRRLTGDRISRQPAWSPDGRWIAHVKIDVSSSDLWVMDDASGNGRQLTNNYSPDRVKNNWAFRPQWWPDSSRLLYLSDETTYDLMLWQVGLDGKNRRPVLTVPDREGGIDMPTVTPDGRRLAAVTYRAPGGRPQIWTFAFPGGPWRTAHGGSRRRLRSGVVARRQPPGLFRARRRTPRRVGDGRRRRQPAAVEWQWCCPCTELVARRQVDGLHLRRERQLRRLGRRQ